MIGNVANLSLWEWFKLRRRWMLWILLVFAILFAQLAVWGQFFSYRNLQTTGGELTVPASLQQQQGRAPRTVACNDLLSGDLARQPADLEAQVVAGLAAQCRQQASTLPARLARAYQSFTLPGSVSTALGIVQTLALILIVVRFGGSKARVLPEIALIENVFQQISRLCTQFLRKVVS